MRMRAILDFINIFITVVLAQATVIKLSYKYRTHVPVVLPWRVSKETNKGRTFGGLIIVLNTRYLKEVNYEWKVVAHTVYHEYRHVWQLVYHTGVFLWWGQHRKLYKCMYRHPICSIEADAFAFGDSLGKENRVDLLLKYNALWLEDRFV